MKSVLLIRDPKTKEQEYAWSKFDDFSRQVKVGKTTGKGGTDSEQKYSLFYQELVKNGLVQQLKKKFR